MNWEPEFGYLLLVFTLLDVLKHFQFFKNFCRFLKDCSWLYILRFNNAFLKEEIFMVIPNFNRAVHRQFNFVSILPLTLDIILRQVPDWFQ